jgi:hypothetical protein
MDVKTENVPDCVAMDTDKASASDALRNGTLPPESPQALEAMLLHHQSTFARFFKDRSQYEMFMMLPISNKQRRELLETLCGRAYS